MKTWFITGASTGFGKELAMLLLSKGHKVVATARDISKLEDLQKNAAPGHLLCLPLDITNADAIEVAVSKALSQFHSIDVLVNNAGYGLVGGMEEPDEAQIRNQFETNLFGTIALTRRILPVMRKQKSGYILVLSSIAGLASTPGFTYYNGTKFALEGMFEALAGEVAHLGIHVTLVEPGPFRTNFAGSSIQVANAIEEYTPVLDKIRQYIRMADGNQAGDPVKAAEILIDLANESQPPLRLLLGKMAFDRFNAKYRQMLDEAEKWKDVTISADFV